MRRRSCKWGIYHLQINEMHEEEYIRKTIKIFGIFLLSVGLCFTFRVDNEYLPLILFAVWTIWQNIIYKQNPFKIEKNDSGMIFLGFYIALTTVFGMCLWKHIDIKWYYIIIIVCLIALIAFVTLKCVYRQLNEKLIFENRTKSKVNDIVFFVIMFVGIFVGWIPELLSNYPGILTADSTWQWEQAIGVSALSNHHPVMHTLMIRFAQIICYHLYGKLIPLYAVFIYSLLQMGIMACVFSCTLVILRKMNLPNWFMVFCIFYYALFPMNAIFSIYMTKDSLFASFILLMTTRVYKIYETNALCLNSVKAVMISLIPFILVILFRSNGIFVSFILATSLGIIYFRRNHRIIWILVGVCVFYCLWNGIIKLNHVGQPDIKEALGMPINQIACVVTEHESELSESEKTEISKVIPLEEIVRLYEPGYSDPIKFSNNFNSDQIRNHIGEYGILWIKLIFKYPGTCLKASANLTIGYWFPAVKKGAVSNGLTDKYSFLKQIGVSGYSESTLLDRYFGIGVRNSILESWLWSIGLCVIFMLTTLLYSVKAFADGKSIVVFAPNLLVWVSILLLTPSYCETRYAYSIFICIPFYIGVMINAIGKKNVL